MRLRFVRASGFEITALQLLSNFGARLAGDPDANSTSIDALADGPDVTFHITGIEASPLEFPPLGPDLSPALHLTPEFGLRYGHQIVSSPIMYVHLKQPDLLDAFAKGIERLAEGSPVGLHREPPAAAAEGRDRDPGGGHRPPARRAARGVGAGVHRRPGPAAPGLRGGA